ncbi:pyridoxamine 5-phosphate oxidase [Pseudonocardia sp. MH-G8]|nr:pyridoxamine 5-phosphate oxidase [Pseudonocardia sp. MH-G8]
MAPHTQPLAGTRSVTVQRSVDVPSPSVEHDPLPGSGGEHELQCAYGTETRARRFYADQLRDRLLPTMMAFVQRMEMVFVASADGRGECDASLRAGPPGFIRVLDARTLAYPEYRGNGVHASLGNIAENCHVGLLMVDFVQDLIGLHVNGAARIVEGADFTVAFPQVPADLGQGPRVERWVVVDVEEAYVHCRKHIPRMARVHEKREWGTDDPGRKGGDYFGAKQTPRWRPRPHAARRRFPSTTHLGGGSSRTLRPR